MSILYRQKCVILLCVINLTPMNPTDAERAYTSLGERLLFDFAMSEMKL
jgi:hypothetical protein